MALTQEGNLAVQSIRGAERRTLDVQTSLNMEGISQEAMEELKRKLEEQHSRSNSAQKATETIPLPPLYRDQGTSMEKPFPPRNKAPE